MHGLSQLVYEEPKILPPRSNKYRFGLLDESGLKRTKAPWCIFCEFVCALQVFAGLIFGLASSSYLFDFSRLTGLILAVLLVLIGLAGMLGAKQRRSSILNLHVVGVLFGVLVCFHFMSQISREVHMDCALAELHVRTQKLQHFAMTQSSGSLFHAVYSRITEMEDALGTMESRLADSLHRHAKIVDVKLTDAQLVEEKLKHLSQHAEKFITSLYNNANLTAETVASLADDVRQDLSNRVDVASRVLRRVEATRQSEGDNVITFEEYQALLNALSNAVSQPSPTELVTFEDHSDLGRAHYQLDSIKGAIQRVNSHKATHGSVHDLSESEQAREERRARWDHEFSRILEEHQASLPQLKTLHDMPQHCLAEAQGGRLLGYVAFFLLLLQGLSVYAVLTLQLEAKKE